MILSPSSQLLLCLRWPGRMLPRRRENSMFARLGASLGSDFPDGFLGHPLNVVADEAVPVQSQVDGGDEVERLGKPRPASAL